jgi:hypothetical protein
MRTEPILGKLCPPAQLILEQGIAPGFAEGNSLESSRTSDWRSTVLAGGRGSFLWLIESISSELLE